MYLINHQKNYYVDLHIERKLSSSLWSITQINSHQLITLVPLFLLNWLNNFFFFHFFGPIKICYLQ